MNYYSKSISRYSWWMKFFINYVKVKEFKWYEKERKTRGEGKNVDICKLFVKWVCFSTFKNILIIA